MGGRKGEEGSEGGMESQREGGGREREGIHEEGHSDQAIE